VGELRPRGLIAWGKAKKKEAVYFSNLFGAKSFLQQKFRLDMVSFIY
jgi:hypothetical protein